MNFFRNTIFIIIFFIVKINIVSATENTAFLDIDYILNNSNFGKSIINELENINKSNIKIINDKEKILRDKKEKIDKTKNISSKEKIKEDVDKFNNDIVNLRSEKKK